MKVNIAEEAAKGQAIITPTDNNSPQATRKLIEEKALCAVFILDNVLLPLLRQESSQTLPESNLRSSQHLSYSKKFVSRVCRFVMQEEKGIRLTLPPNIKLNDLVSELGVIPDDIHASTPLIIDDIEDIASGWSNVIHQSIEAELEQENHIIHRGPMGEVDFWRRRHVVLSNFKEQLNAPHFQKVMGLLKKFRAQSPVTVKIQESIAVVTKLAVEAADNAKFLNTLERHIRTLNDGSLSGTITAVPALVDGMRMVWTVSRHYNKDERMFPLMKRVAYQVALRCHEFMRPKIVFGGDLNRSREIIFQCKEFLVGWKRAYMTTRERIELMGTSQRRWEFDRFQLFSTTDYMADICADLLTMIEAIIDFKQFFSQELLTIVGKNEEICDVLHMIKVLKDKLVSCVDSFDVFDKTMNTNWKRLKETFEEDVSKVERQVTNSIEHLFQDLRSSEKAFELIISLKGLKTRASISQLIEDRNHDILNRYEKELSHAIEFFRQNKGNVSLCRRYEKIVASVSWADQLYNRTKRAIVSFKNSGMLESPKGMKIKKKYLGFAREVDKYKTQLIEEWSIAAVETCMHDLQRPLFSVAEDSTLCAQAAINNCEDSGDCIVLIKTNFSRRVRDVLIEAELFDSQGYKIPEDVLHLTLQKRIYERYSMKLDKLVKRHNTLLKGMTVLECKLLKGHIQAMRRVLETKLNWTSQSIWSFITTGKNAIDTMESKLIELRKHSLTVETVVSNLAADSLFSTDTLSKTSLQSFDDIITSVAAMKSSFLADEYKSISPLLRKIEMALFHTNSGCSKDCIDLYNYWEKRMYNATVELSVRSILSFIFKWEKSIFINDRKDCLRNYQSAIEQALTLVADNNNNYIRWKHETCNEVTKSQDGDSSFINKYTLRPEICSDPSFVSILLGQRERFLAQEV